VARRLPRVIALAVLLLLCLPTAAFADYSSRLEAPSNGVVTGKTEIQVRVNRDPLDVPVTGVRVRPATGGEWQRTTCKSGCDGERSSVHAFDLDPRSGAPFGDGIMPNGTFQFDVRASRSLNQDPVVVGRLSLSLRVPGSAVGGLAATVSDQSVRLAWSRAPEPDIDGYRVERCAGTCDGSGTWRSQGTTSPSASSFTDEPGVGTHSYRVVTVRSGGGDGRIETVSSPVTAEVEPAPASPATSEGESSGDGGSGDGNGDAGGSSQPGSGTSDRDRSPRSADAPSLSRDGTPTSDASPSTAPRSSTSRSGGLRFGSAPSVSLGRGGAGIPELPGIGDIFRGELDYSADDPQTAGGQGNGGEGGDEGDEVLLGAPGGGNGTFLSQITDPNRVAVPIAGGLLMTAVGLHLWRWLRIPLA
jgi:hypothetical protein